MDCPIEEELVVRLVINRSTSGWVTSGVVQGPVLRPTILFNIFINYTESEIKCTLRKSVEDTKLYDAVDMPEGWKTIQGVPHRVK